MTEANPRRDQTAVHQAGVDDSRREALAKMGRFAGYTAPAMLLLLGATKARAHASGTGAQRRKKNHNYSWKKKKKTHYFGKRRGVLKKIFG